MKFRLKVKCGKRWVWGLNTYKTYEEANVRMQEMQKAGCKVRIAPEAELFRG
jgi:hypothetical protein